jgi:hypothetical protein
MNLPHQHNQPGSRVRQTLAMYHGEATHPPHRHLKNGGEGRGEVELINSVISIFRILNFSFSAF